MLDVARRFSFHVIINITLKIHFKVFANSHKTNRMNVIFSFGKIEFKEKIKKFRIQFPVSILF